MWSKFVDKYNCVWRNADWLSSWHISTKSYLWQWLIGWLVFYGTSTQDRSISANLSGGLLAQAFEDSQQGTYKNIQLHAIQWTYTCNDKQQACLTCLKINNAYNKLHDLEWVKKRKPACNTFSINPVTMKIWMQFNVMPRTISLTNVTLTDMMRKTTKRWGQQRGNCDCQMSYTSSAAR